jgi:hypothetical protein
MSDGERVSDLAVSLIRTWVPIGVGALLGWVATAGHVVVPPGASATAGAVAAGLCAAAYYGLARLLERTAGTQVWPRVARALGRYMLGGVVRVPTYVKPVEPAEPPGPQL